MRCTSKGGLFDVVYDERRPFLVHACDAVTEDLGTRFGMRTYPRESRVRVFIESGHDR